MKKRDWILLAGLLLIAVIMLSAISLTRKDNGSIVTISIDGQVYGSYSLMKNQTIAIDELLGMNTIQIENGEAFMIEADCPDGYCKSQGHISKGNQTIVCLPHKLVVEVSSDDHPIDVIAK